ncbi:MAG: SDR family oxidoreductase [Blastocatellia bacterium]|nr:SDR family oxidoreductase [Blastocatellia bacterium]
MKIALVTGTSTGIGLSSAVMLAQAGLTVVATMRDLSKSEPLNSHALKAGVKLDLRTLDVTTDASVETCVDGILRDYGRIDVVVNNAGAGFLGTLEMTPAEALRQTMEVNFFGVWRVTQAVLPGMRVRRSGRILSVTSVGGLLAQPFNDAYCAAKFAVEGAMESLAPVAKRLGIHVSLIEPGPVNTEFVATVQKGMHAPTESIRADYGPMLEAYLNGTRQAFATIGQTGDDIGKVIVEAATAETPHFRYVTSDIVRQIVAQKYVDPTGDSVVALSGSRLP